MSSTCYIYALINIKTNQAYIGQTFNLLNRQNQHVQDLIRGKHPYKLLQEDFIKYGQAAFEFKVLETCRWTERLEREDVHIMNWIGGTYNKSTFRRFNVI